MHPSLDPASQIDPAPHCSKQSYSRSRLPQLAAFASFLLATLPFASGAEHQKMALKFPPDSQAIPAPVRTPASSIPWTHAEPGPVPNLQEFARESRGVVWLGGPNGAARFNPHASHRWDRWQYFAGPRWLPDDVVENIWADPDAPHPTIWIRTRTGVSRIEWSPMSLAQKARFFDSRIESRHVRHGFVSSSHLREPGKLGSNQTVSSDNDGLWTAMYLAAQSYRYAVTQDPDSGERARRAARALLRLEEITGIPGFPARSFIAAGEPQPADGEWHPTPDGKWRWKGDTSSDEIVGHYYGLALYFDLVAGPDERAAVAAVIERITDHLIRNDYDLIDLDGKPTRWGRWSEAYFETVEGRYESALRATQLLAFLRTAEHITRNPRFTKAYLDRVQRGYAHRMKFYRRWEVPGEINFSDDELAFLSYDPLLRYEKDPRLLEIYREAVRFAWTQIQPDHNPLWNYIAGAGGAISMNRAVRQDSRRTLDRIPMDLIHWNVKNSRRLDVKFRADIDRFNRTQLVEVLPPDERPTSKWNANPYMADSGGNGSAEDDGAFFLLPYWMGRHHGWVR